MATKMYAKKHLGQNFLNKDTITKKIVSLLNVKKDDLVIEIGPGRGALTKHLKDLSCKVLCIEIDSDMKDTLSKYENNNLSVIYEDVLKYDFSKLDNNKVYIIGNLPYYITTPIIEHLIKTLLPKEMIFMVQKEVALRLTSKPGNKEYGYMTVYVNQNYNVNYEFTVTKDNFNPIPKVDSAIISFKKVNDKKITRDYDEFLKMCFHQKRKTLKNNLKQYNWENIKKVLTKYNLNEDVRAESIPIEIFNEIYESIK